MERIRYTLPMTLPEQATMAILIETMRFGKLNEDELVVLGKTIGEVMNDLAEKLEQEALRATNPSTH